MAISLGIDNVCYFHTIKSKKMDLKGFLDTAVSYGATAVQMDPNWPSQDLDLSQKSLEYLGSLLDERKLHIVVKGNSGGMGSLANPPDASAGDIEFFRSKIEAAAKLNSPVVRIVTRAYPYPTSHSVPPPGISRWEVIGWVVENLRQLARHAEAMGVRLVIENHGDLRITEIERIIEEINSPWLGVQFDVLEQAAIFEDPAQAAERLLPYAFTVHWCDAYPKLSNSGFCVSVCMPGEGIIDLDQAFKKITSLRQDIYIFAAFQAESDTNESRFVKAYLENLHDRLNQIHTKE